MPTKKTRKVATKAWAVVSLGGKLLEAYPKKVFARGASLIFKSHGYTSKVVECQILYSLPLPKKSKKHK